jgi:prephenate dehydrogenase
MSAPAQAAARFVPGHPIAGSERSGVAAARADLFHRLPRDPDPGRAHGPRGTGAYRSAVVVSRGAAADHGVREHDAVLAATSHLPHMLAYALVDGLAQSPLRDDIFRFAAGGFRDFTRIASSDPVMWRDIALANVERCSIALMRFPDTSRPARADRQQRCGGAGGTPSGRPNRRGTSLPATLQSAAVPMPRPSNQTRESSPWNFFWPPAG